MDKVKIGYRIYSILTPEFILDNNNKNRWGQAHYSEGTLSVSNQLKDKHLKINTLIHEMLHAIGFEYNVFRGLEDQEEFIVDTLANALCTVMKDNPDLFYHFIKELSDESRSS